VPYRLLLSNGAPERPPFPYADHVQQLNPTLLDEALRAGESAARQSLVPYGIHVPPGPPESFSAEALAAARQRLDLPAHRPLVLSVGWISRVHKRMDHVIEEIAGLPADRRPYLALLGDQDEASVPVIELATRRLGREGFCARTVPYAEVADYYRVADAFVLAALGEAFGRVFLEALAAGLPCIVHDHPIHRYVLDREGTFVDMAAPGVLSQALAGVLADLPSLQSAEARARRRESVRARFGWETLAPAYMDMFRRCAGSNPS
jgi:glycosyltransferase involved in cell wall biosynthesis